VSARASFLSHTGEIASRSPVVGGFPPFPVAGPLAHDWHGLSTTNKVRNYRFRLPYDATGVMNRHVRRTQQQKGKLTAMKNETAATRRDRPRCGTGRERRAGEGIIEEGQQPEKGRAQGQESRQDRPSLVSCLR
jgi:hypothetical protein